jgi:hypothetical protein
MVTRDNNSRQRKNIYLRFNLMVIVLLSLLSKNAAAGNHNELGQPWDRHTIDNSSQGADGVHLGDVDGDGLLDIVTGWEEGGQIRVYLHPGKDEVKKKWPTVTVGRVQSPEDATFVDLDGDGILDVVSATEGKTKTIFVHWAPRSKEHYLDSTAWTTAAITTSKSLTQWMFTLPLQIDDQNGPDLVAGSKNEGGQISWFEAPRDPHDLTTWERHQLYKAGWIMSLKNYDMDGDGDLDIVASDRHGPKRGCLWLERSASNGKNFWREHRIGSTGNYEAMFLTIADLDRDWFDDLLVAVREGPIRYFRRTRWSPPEWETHEIALPPMTGTGKSVEVGDINLDGKPDIVFSCENAHGPRAGVMWMSYDKTPTAGEWTYHAISGPEGVKFDLVKLVDLDGDGDLDVITCEEVSNLGVIWYENPLQ